MASELTIWNEACQQWETITIGGETPDCHDFIQSETSSYITVCSNGSDTENGSNLNAALTRAKTLTPNGQALSATNRACVIVPPGKYNLDYGEAGACVPLILDTEYVDIIGLTTDRAQQHIYGTPVATNSGVIIQTANDVHISNLTVEILTAYGTANGDNTDSAAYWPATDLSSTVVDNVYFKGNEGEDDVLYSMRVGRLEYSGTFTSCTGGCYSFGCYYGSESSGIFTYCIGGCSSFGGKAGTASGVFTNCTGGDYSFGGGGTASGMFTNCTGGNSSFGYDGM